MPRVYDTLDQIFGSACQRWAEAEGTARDLRKRSAVRVLAAVAGWTQLPSGNTFAKWLKLNIVAYLVTRKTAKDYLEPLRSKTTLSTWMISTQLDDLCSRTQGQRIQAVPPINYPFLLQRSDPG